MALRGRGQVCPQAVAIGRRRCALVVKNLVDQNRQIDALVLPSRESDPFGMVVAEAMAMGVPCLITDACGIASCLEAARDVVVVEPDSVRSLLKGIQQLQDAKKYDALKTNVTKAAKQQFSVSTMVDRYETLFTERTADVKKR